MGQTSVNAGTSTDYTATEDCFFKVLLCSYGGESAKVSIMSGSTEYEVYRFRSNSTTAEQVMFTFPVQSGQKVRVTSTPAIGSYYFVYGMQKES